MSFAAFSIAETMLRNRERFFSEIEHDVALKEKIQAMLACSVIFLAIYGALLGTTHSIWQSVSSALKLPLLFLVTLVICAPALYILSALFDLRQPLSRSITLVLAAITVTAITLLSFATISLFFIVTTPGYYQLFKLLNVVFFMIAGAAGASFLNQGIKLTASTATGQPRLGRLVFYLWVVVYIFVGCQMAWTLRPFVGYPDAPFEPVRQLGGNFYDNILTSTGEVLGFLIVR